MDTVPNQHNQVHNPRCYELRRCSNQCSIIFLKRVNFSKNDPHLVYKSGRYLSLVILERSSVKVSASSITEPTQSDDMVVILSAFGPYTLRLLATMVGPEYTD